MTGSFVIAALGSKALWLMYLWLASAIIASELSRSKGYGERPGLGTGMLLSALAPIIWLFIPPKDDLAEWHTRKPWQRRHKPREDEMAAAMAAPARPSGGQAASEAEPRTSEQKSEISGAEAAPPDESGSPGSRPGEGRDSG